MLRCGRHPLSMGRLVLPGCGVRGAGQSGHSRFFRGEPGEGNAQGTLLGPLREREGKTGKKGNPAENGGTANKGKRNHGGAGLGPSREREGKSAKKGKPA